MSEPAPFPIHLVFLGRAESTGPNGLTVDSNNRIQNKLKPFLAPSNVESETSGPYIRAIHTLAIDYTDITTNQELTRLQTLFANDSTSYYLICRDSSNCTSSRAELWSILNYMADSILADKDFFFLGKWMDNCMAHDKSGAIGLTNIVTNSVPTGFQSVLITPSGIAKLQDNTTTKTPNLDLTLNEMIVHSSNSVKTAACVPNFFAYDPSYDTTVSITSAKTQECGSTISDFKPARDEDLAFFWFLIIFIVAGLLAWIVYRLANTIDYRFSPNVMKIAVPYLSPPTA